MIAWKDISALLPFLMMLIVAASNAFAAATYEIIDTGISARGGLVRRNVYWIDNQQVLFPGYDQTRSIATGSGTSPQSVLYIWDIKARQVKLYADIRETDYVCYSNGFVSYAVSREGERYIREGALGAEKERKWNPPVPNAKIDFNELSCKDFDLSGMDKVYPGYWFAPLRDGLGYRGGPKTTVSDQKPTTSWFYLHSGKGKKPIPLPVSKMDRISYSEYLGAYVIDDIPSQRGKDANGTMWLLYPDGRVTEAIIPAGPWMSGSVGYAPTKEGIIMWSAALGLKSRFDPGNAGIYLVNDHKISHLITGLPGMPAVSPDGCKVAAAVHPRTAVGQKATLRLIILCN